jgi:hypothetical protein
MASIEVDLSTFDYKASWFRKKDTNEINQYVSSVH